MPATKVYLISLADIATHASMITHLKVALRILNGLKRDTIKFYLVNFSHDFDTQALLEVISTKGFKITTTNAQTLINDIPLVTVKPHFLQYDVINTIKQLENPQYPSGVFWTKQAPSVEFHYLQNTNKEKVAIHEILDVKTDNWDGRVSSLAQVIHPERGGRYILSFN